MNHGYRLLVFLIAFTSGINAQTLPRIDFERYTPVSYTHLTLPTIYSV
jgi:hypothetical protein